MNQAANTALPDYNAFYLRRCSSFTVNSITSIMHMKKEMTSTEVEVKLYYRRTLNIVINTKYKHLDDDDED
jgi:hypothetical protein